MRVAFDSRPGGGEVCGIGRYVRCLLPELNADGRGEVSESHRPRARDVDVYHSPWIDGALLRCPVPMVVTVHDLVPLKRRGEFLRNGMRIRLRYLAVQRAVRVIVPTQAVAADVAELLRIDEDRIAVIWEAPAACLSPCGEGQLKEVRARYELPEHYLLWVGGLDHPEPRKRVAALASATRRMPLVLVGRTARWAHELEDVTLTGEVPDEDLAALYSGAHALVFPSEDEGFGLPPVEALACGTPVVACDVPAVREVLGDRATLVPCNDVDALVAAAETAARPAPPPPKWTWADAADATWRVYEDAAERRTPAAPTV
jgi:glycosyltransferase involved in cell wall biosynthesis